VRQVVAPQLCGMNQVAVSLWVGPTPRPNTQHRLSWIRSHGANHGFTDPRRIAFTEYYIGVQSSRPPVGPINFKLVLTFPHRYIAHELLQYNGAVACVDGHENGHAVEWERNMVSQMPAAVTEINSDVWQVVAPAQRAALQQRVDGILHRLAAQWFLTMRQNADRWDSADYERLHAALEALGVPTM